jgi:peptidoglycan/LPS O-acetylase OafA/YrhL
VAFLYLVFYRRRWPDWIKLLGVVPAGLGVALAIQLAEDWPPSSELGRMLLAAAGVVVLAVVLRVLFERRERAAAAAPPPTSP